MREILQQLVADHTSGKALAYCRLVETRGSTPQKAGAAMLVYADGSQAGTLGGGCVEAEVKRRAIATLEAGEAEIAKFELDHDYGWDDGLICGGRMIALIQPLRPDDEAAYFHRFAERLVGGAGCTEAIVYDATASGLPAALTMLFDEADQLVDQQPEVVDFAKDPRGAGSLARSTTTNIRPLASRPRPYAIAGVGYLPLLPRCPLVIVGGGHVGQAVAQLAADLDFEVTVIDDRADCISQERFPRATQRLAGPIDRVLPQLDISPSTYCLIVTRGHNHDQEALYHLAERGARYLGLIGSRRKIKLIFENLAAEGISAEALEAVYAPVGLDIGSQTVAEIAVSICAELVAHRNREGVVPGRNSCDLGQSQHYQNSSTNR